MTWTDIDDQLAPLVAFIVIIGGVIAFLYHLRQYRVLLRDTQEKERQRIERAVLRKAEMDALKKEIEEHIEETKPIMQRFFTLETQFAVMAEANKNAAENVKHLSQMVIATQENIGELIRAIAKQNGSR